MTPPLTDGYLDAMERLVAAEPNRTEHSHCCKIIGELVAEVRRLRGLLEERWPNLTHQSRDRLLAAAGRQGVSPEGKWLSEAAIEAIERLEARVAALTSAAPPAAGPAGAGPPA